MKEHLTAEQIDDFRERKLSPAELFALGEHLGGCAACRAQIQSVHPAAAAMQETFRQSARFPEHLSYEQLSALADNSLDEIDREIAESHLSICPACEREAVELRAFAASLETDRTPIVVSNEPSFWEKIRAFVFTPAFGASFAAILIFATLAVVWLSRENSKNEIARTENSPTPTGSLANNQILNQNTQVTPTPKIIEENNQQPTVPPNANKQADEEKMPRVVSAPKAELAQNTPRNNELSAQDSETIRRALENREIETPQDLKNLFAQTGNLMGNQFSGGVPFKIETPTRVIINVTQPVLRWQNLAGADEYRVGIYDENFNEVAKIRNLTANQWRVSKPLARGRIYVWEVEALKNGNVIGSAPSAKDAEAKFKILEAAKSSRMQRDLRKNPRSALWKGIVYAKYGLLPEAEREFSQYSRENPNSIQAKDLLDKIRALRK